MLTFLAIIFGTALAGLLLTYSGGPRVDRLAGVHGDRGAGHDRRRWRFAACRPRSPT